ncbi:hypothetical protein [Xanthomonas vasicola]|uniref:hypothetical protein n=1 Tax=Xanthomonas vasicola TaxID=56459 RepID=UPI001648D76F|nr:hypothetical protein [Xanthomonas vasicola]
MKIEGISTAPAKRKNVNLLVVPHVDRRKLALARHRVAGVDRSRRLEGFGHALALDRLRCLCRLRLRVDERQEADWLEPYKN